MAGNPGAGSDQPCQHCVPLTKQLHYPHIAQPYSVYKCSFFLCGHPLSPSPPQTQSELLEFASILLVITSLRSVVATLRTDPLDPLDALTPTFGLGSVGGASLAGKASFRLFLRPGRGFREITKSNPSAKPFNTTQQPESHTKKHPQPRKAAAETLHGPPPQEFCIQLGGFWVPRRISWSLYNLLWSTSSAFPLRNCTSAPAVCYIPWLLTTDPRPWNESASKTRIRKKNPSSCLWRPQHPRIEALVPWWW